MFHTFYSSSPTCSGALYICFMLIKKIFFHMNRCIYHFSVFCVALSVIYYTTCTINALTTHTYLYNCSHCIYLTSSVFIFMLLHYTVYFAYLLPMFILFSYCIYLGIFISIPYCLLLFIYTSIHMYNTLYCFLQIWLDD